MDGQIPTEIQYHSLYGNEVHPIRDFAICGICQCHCSNVVDLRTEHERMYWSAWEVSPKIERAGLHGFNRQEIIDIDIEHGMK